MCSADISEKHKNSKFCDDCSIISKKESFRRYAEKNKENRKEYAIKYRVENKEKIKSYQEENKESRKEYSKEYSSLYYEKNKERLVPIRKEWREKNKEKERINNKDRYLKKDKERLSKYYKENKEEINKRKKEYRKTDEYKKWKKEYDLRNSYKYRYRDSLKSVIRRLNRDKNDYTNKLLGYSDLDFKIHIENQFTECMSWENRDSFEIDHIIPIVAFIEETPLNIVSSLENLKPINPIENIKKFISIDYNYIKLYEKYIDYLIPEYKEKIIDYLEIIE
jgi:hypothetical protein